MILSILLVILACSDAPTATAPLADPPTVATKTELATSGGEHAHGPSQAGADHAHASPHGGIVQTVGDMHVEALMMPAGVMFYLSDGAQQPLPVAGYGGNAVVKGPSGVTTVDLVPMGDHLHAAAPLEQGQPASAVLTLTHDAKAVSASFETQGVGLESHDHTSLHGGQVSMWGEYHLEYAPQDGQYRLWLTDHQRNPVSGPATGSVKDGSNTLPLTQDASGMLTANGAGAGTRPIVVDVNVGGTMFSLGFNAVAVQPAHAQPAHAHGEHEHGDHAH